MRCGLIAPILLPVQLDYLRILLFSFFYGIFAQSVSQNPDSEDRMVSRSKEELDYSEVFQRYTSKTTRKSASTFSPQSATVLLSRYEIIVR